MENIIDKLPSKSKYISSEQVDEIIKSLLDKSDVEKETLDEIINTIYESNLKLIETKLAHIFENKEFITVELLGEIKDFLLHQDKIDREGVNNILKALFENNVITNLEIQKENKAFQTSLDQRESNAKVEITTGEDKEVQIRPIKDKKEQSLNIDISFYITLIDEADTYEEIEQFLPNKNKPNYLEIIDSLLIYYYNELFEVKRVLKEEQDPEFIELEKSIKEKINYIKKYKSMIISSNKTIIKPENIVIFLTTHMDNACIKSDFKSIDEEHYADLIMLLESIKDGTFREAKTLNSNSALRGLSEVRAHPHQSRITFKHLTKNIYVVLQAFVKKADNPLVNQNAMRLRYELYGKRKNELLEKVKNPRFIAENKKMYEEFLGILSNQKRGDGSGKVKKSN